MNERSGRTVLMMDRQDNVAIACREIPAGKEILPGIHALSVIPTGHKVAVRPIKCGEPVMKYDTIIGYATEDIRPGTWMHNHNISFRMDHHEYQFCADYKPTRLIPPERRRTFLGYVRGDGRVATRNCLAVMVTCNCAATVGRRIAEHFTPEVLAQYPHVDAVVPLITSLGCGTEKSGMPLEYIRRVMGGHLKNPNFAGAVVVALGCETNNIDLLFEITAQKEGPMLKKLVIQDMGSAAAVRAGIEMVEQMLSIAETARRQPVSIEYLTIGLECGGSDAFSGCSANPALGRAMDMLVQNGGTAVLTETTELFSAEVPLTRRAKNPEVAQKLIDAIQWWVSYSAGRDAQINGKVTPGNNRGGLTNVLEKAMGSARKGGSTPLNAVVGYAEPLTEKGLVIMDAPSYDPLSAAAMFAGGANLCAFTTGRGSCYGTRHLPTVKISSNSDLAKRMPEDIDLNAGAVIDGEKTLNEMAEDIFEELIAVASGKQTKSEAFGMGGDEFVIWNIGITA